VADIELKTRIKGLLKGGYFPDPDDLVDVSDGDDDNVHIVVVSRKFDGLRFQEKNDLIWGELIAKLKEPEWQKVSLSVGVTPEEIKGF